MKNVKTGQVYKFADFIREFVGTDKNAARRFKACSLWSAIRPIKEYDGYFNISKMRIIVSSCGSK